MLPSLSVEMVEQMDTSLVGPDADAELAGTELIIEGSDSTGSELLGRERGVVVALADSEEGVASDSDGEPVDVAGLLEIVEPHGSVMVVVIDCVADETTISLVTIVDVMH